MFFAWSAHLPCRSKGHTTIPLTARMTSVPWELMLAENVVDQFSGLRFVHWNTSRIWWHPDVTPVVGNGSAARTRFDDPDQHRSGIPQPREALRNVAERLPPPFAIKTVAGCASFRFGELRPGLCKSCA